MIILLILTNNGEVYGVSNNGKKPLLMKFDKKIVSIQQDLGGYYVVDIDGQCKQNTFMVKNVSSGY